MVSGYARYLKIAIATGIIGYWDKFLHILSLYGEKKTLKVRSAMFALKNLRYVVGQLYLVEIIALKKEPWYIQNHTCFQLSTLICRVELLCNNMSL